MSELHNEALIVVERRDSDRNNMELNALGMVPGKDSALKCQILDLSDTGAKLRLTGVGCLPEYFKLFVPETKALLECEIVWRTTHEAGVRFRTKAHL